MSWLDPYKWLISLALVALLAAGGWFAWWHHGNARYDAGMAYVRDVDAKALATAQKAADAKTAQLLAISVKARKDAANARQSLADYMRSYPLGPIRVRLGPCIGGTVSQTSAIAGGTTGTSPGSQAGSAMPQRSPTETPDIRPELDAILQGFGGMAIQLGEFQQRAVK